MIVPSYSPTHTPAHATKSASHYPLLSGVGELVPRRVEGGSSSEEVRPSRLGARAPKAPVDAVTPKESLEQFSETGPDRTRRFN
jgi:hypothetical protein